MSTLGTRRSRAVRPPQRNGRGPLVFLLGMGLVLALVLGIARPLALDAFAAFAGERDTLLRIDAIRGLVAASAGADAELAVDPAGAPRPFVVRRGDTIRTVAARLAADGLVRSALGFTVAAYSGGSQDAMQAGTYSLSPAMTPHEIAMALRRAPGEQVTLRLIEGWRLTEIAAAVAKTFPAIAPEAFIAAAVVGTRADPFLQGLDPRTPLEGFLFPDTYQLRPNASPQEIVETLVATFAERAGPLVLRAREQGRSAYDLVRLASIVEREARDRSESATIAGVYANRLRIGMKLDADPTIQYALGRWGELTLRDLETDSPYNTYRHAGLPPTPICSPGQAALAGAAQPADVPYLYFVAKADGSGGHAFARTLEEQEANRVKYGNR